MSNVIKLPVIAGVEITKDEQDRFNLNALHKAHLKCNPELHKNSKQPSDWLKLEGTKELISVISNSEDLQVIPIHSASGRYGGTFAHELLAISYAGWISPKFQLQVNQTFIDYKNGNLKPVNPVQMSRIDILQLAMQAEEENIKLVAQVEEMTPKAEALDRIAKADGSMCITDAAKDLQIRPKDLFSWLSANKWIYKRTGGSGWVAYQDKLQRLLLEHKVTVVSRTDGSEKTTEQVRVTSKGLTVLSGLIRNVAA